MRLVRLYFPQNIRRLKDASWKHWRKVIIQKAGLQREFRTTGVDIGVVDTVKINVKSPFPFTQTSFVSHHYLTRANNHTQLRWNYDRFSGLCCTGHQFSNCANRLFHESKSIASLVSGGQLITDKPEGPESEEGKEKERAEQKRVQENSVRAVKFTLIAFGSILLGGGIYIFFVWGAPLRDRMGTEVRDEFSDLPFVEQYFKRCISEIRNCVTFLAEPSREKLLPDTVKPPYIQPPYTLLIELTGVLVHPDWTYKTGWRFKKRPGINYFLDKITSDYAFEIVIYTQEGGFTAFPIVEALDQKKVVSYTLFRDSTKYENGHHIKDLDRINRDLNRVIMIDCNPASVENHRSNSIVLPKWLGNDEDRSLFDLAALLQTISSNGIEDVRGVLEHYSQFDDPISEFRQKQRILAEQEKEQEALMKQIVSKTQMPAFTSWVPSFLRR